MWNDPASAVGPAAPPPLYRSAAQLTGFDLRVGDGGASTGCEMLPGAAPPARPGYRGWVLLCDPGSTLALRAPGLARSSAQQLADLLVRVCTADAVVGPRNVSLYIQE
jgi:hypothetical protein